MREILFRGKHIHVHPKNEHLDGTWVYGYLCDENHINAPKLEGEFLVNPKTVCQYTGLTDKKGRKIFEGDIVNSDGTIGIVKFGNYKNGFHFGYYVEWIKCPLLRQELGYWDGKSKIIGNIFDNPELLQTAGEDAGQYADMETLASATN